MGIPFLYLPFYLNITYIKLCPWLTYLHVSSCTSCSFVFFYCYILYQLIVRRYHNKNLLIHIRSRNYNSMWTSSFFRKSRLHQHSHLIITLHSKRISQHGYLSEVPIPTRRSYIISLHAQDDFAISKSFLLSFFKVIPGKFIWLLRMRMDTTWLLELITGMGVFLYLFANFKHSNLLYR